MKARVPWNYGCDLWPSWPRWYRLIVYNAYHAVHSPLKTGRFRNMHFPVWWRKVIGKYEHWHDFGMVDTSPKIMLIACVMHLRSAGLPRRRNPPHRAEMVRF